MSRLVILSLGQGNLKAGFPFVTAHIWELDNFYQMQFTASLPAAPEIDEMYRKLQSIYSVFYHRLRWSLDIEEIDDVFEIEEAGITNVSDRDINYFCQELRILINAWLNSIEFRKIEHQLRTQLIPSEEIHFIIETNDDLLRRLPWHLWSFFEDYPKAELALSALEYQKTHKFNTKAQKSKVRILAIFGSSERIDISQDMAFLEQLSTGAEIEFLVEPTPDKFHNQLWQQDWDILFFAGHSCSQEKGYLQLNQKDTISLDQLKYALKQAISRGLRLAIFNSCDGLGLAQQLQDLQIPQVIVMREPVPDVVAQEFLKYFLAEFSRGQSLYTAMRSARARLQQLEGEYPCASWLPVICTNPAEPPMVWQVHQSHTQRVDKVGSLVATSPRIKPTTHPCRSQAFSKTAKPNLLASYSFPIVDNRRLQTLLVASVFVAASVIGVRHLGRLTSWNSSAYSNLILDRNISNSPFPFF
ncbi:CHAT domain-containing protein [Mastigocladopsis repens]|uniref:CHAT domain-containing protein n=1 Tax=Mastigocladopsis repens TaxID=221287 RepID=UPI0003660F5D|nr:CHAT domain-containing protein [Mastigocladopsis repens]